MDNVVQRLHAALAEALERRHPGFDSERVTVAEIYQELVPYRTVRGSVGFEMNADYEHALLRLLAGEGERVRLEPENVRQELQRELASSNPDVTIVRRYAACEVRVERPPEGEEPAPAGDWGEERWSPPEPGLAAPPPAEVKRPWEEPEAELPGTPVSAAPDEAPVPEVPVPHAWEMEVAAVAEVERELPPASSGRSAPAEAHCAFCRGDLPLDRPVRFCPFCGVDQQLRPCPRCGEVLERGWRYCVTCGAPAPGPSASA